MFLQPGTYWGSDTHVIYVQYYGFCCFYHGYFSLLNVYFMIDIEFLWLQPILLYICTDHILYSSFNKVPTGH